MSIGEVAVELENELFKAKNRIKELEEYNLGLANESCKKSERIAELETGLCRIANGYDDEEEGSLHYFPAYQIAMEFI